MKLVWDTQLAWVEAWVGDAIVMLSNKNANDNKVHMSMLELEKIRLPYSPRVRQICDLAVGVKKVTAKSQIWLPA